MMGIPMVAWIMGTLGYYARDVLTPGQRPPPGQLPPVYPPPGASQGPYAAPYAPPGPPPGYPAAYAPPAPAYAAPPRRWHSPFALDPHMDERTDLAIARALGVADVPTLRGFAQAIERHFPIGAGVLRTRAWHLEQAGAVAAPVQAPPPGAPQAPPFDPTAQPAAPREQVANYAQLLHDIALERPDVAAAAPPPPAIAPDPPVEAAPPKRAPRRAVAAVDPSHANGATPPAPVAEVAPPPAQVTGQG